MRVLAALIIIAVTTPVFAQEGDVPLPRRPPPSEAAEPVAAETAAPAALESEEETEPPDAATPATGEPEVPLPRRRPKPDEPKPGDPATNEAKDTAGDEAEPPKPRIYQAACPAVLLGQVEARALPPISDGQCGERSPLAVTGLLVNGRMVPLSGEVTLNCGMASALPEWASAIDSYLRARENTEIARIVVGTSYFCRNRNNAADGDLSEHGFANALDVVGFELDDGRTISLPNGWLDPLSPAGRLMRFAHDAGCARFTTTLGPEANSLHADHLHLDLGCHGQRCTARLCE
jgi:hypothetical protein